MPRPSTLIFDVNETLSDLAPVRDTFAELGLAPDLAAAWFAATLRDGMALAVADTAAPFAEIAGAAARALLPHGTDDTAADAAAERVLETFLELDVHPDVAAGVDALTELGLDLVTLSNGAARVAESLLDRAGLRHRFSRVLTVEDVGVWKPSPRAYGHALDACGIAPGEAMLVAVHPWDVDGAQRAGLSGAWLNRTGATYPSHFSAPTVTATSLPDLAAQLA